MTNPNPNPNPNPTPPAEPPAPVKVRLRVSDAQCTSFTCANAKGDTLVIDTKGVEVHPEDAPKIIKTAAKHGVTITEVSN